MTDLKGLPVIQQKMLDGTMTKPKSVALVQAIAGETIDAYARGFLGETLREEEGQADEPFAT